MGTLALLVTSMFRKFTSFVLILSVLGVAVASPLEDLFNDIVDDITDVTLGAACAVSNTCDIYYAAVGGNPALNSDVTINASGTCESLNDDGSAYCIAYNALASTAELSAELAGADISTTGVCTCGAFGLSLSLALMLVGLLFSKF